MLQTISEYATLSMWYYTETE